MALHYKEGLPLQDVAKRLGISYATAKRWADAVEDAFLAQERHAPTIDDAARGGDAPW